MKKEYMKSGEIREGSSLHFDGVGFSTQPSVNHFKINKWMRKQGFKWESKFEFSKGLWVHPDRGNIQVEQDEAVRMYKSRRRWWQIW